MHTSLRRRLRTAWLIPFLSVLSIAAHAADHFVSRTTLQFDGSKVAPGDTVTLQAGARPQLNILDLRGTAEKPILVRNDVTASGPVVISRTSATNGGQVFACISCIHVVIDGTGKWNGAPEAAYCGAPAGRDGCGIKVTANVKGDLPTIFLRLPGFTSDITVRGVEIAGRFPESGPGMNVGVKLDDVSLKAVDYPGVWRENVIFEKNYVHNTLTEGFYIGPICCGPEGTDRGAHTGGFPLRNITIRHNLVENVGWDGMQLKTAYQGTNNIHDNIIRNSGLDTRTDIPPGELMGIGCENSRCNIYRNLVLGSGESSYQLRNHTLAAEFGPLEVNIFNNVSVNAGSMGTSNGHGVTLMRESGDVARQKISVYNNTIINPAIDGIGVRGANLGSDTRISSNIIASAGRSPIMVPSGSTVTGNGISDAAGTFRFVDLANGDFRLSDDSPARDAGSSALFAAEDFNGVERPQGSAPDQGAFEFITNPPPKPPLLQ
jgi:hypothetical protein